MKIIKKVVTVLLCVSILMTGMSERVYASEQKEVYTAGYECIIQDGNVLRVSSEGSILAEMLYDELGYRISKRGISNCEYVYEHDRLITEIRDGVIINYTYGYDELGNIIMTGFVIDDVEYTFLYADGNMITGIMDGNGVELVKYDYDGINCISVLKCDNGNWISETDDNFIGNYNKIRCYGAYWDEELNWYYDNRTYSDCTTGKIIGLQENMDILTDYNPFISGLNEGIMLLAYDDVDEEVEAWADALLSNSSYNSARTEADISSMSTVELIARVIYGENNVYLTDQVAMSWLIMNRMNYTLEPSRFPDTLREVVLQGTEEDGNISYEFDALANSEAYEQKTSLDTAWACATYQACLLCTTTDVDCWNSLSPKPYGISNQIYFRSTKHLSNFRMDGGQLYYYYSDSERRDVYNVCVPGKGVAVTYSALDALCRDSAGNIPDNTYNIYFYHIN